LAELVEGTFGHVVSAYAAAFVGKASWGRGSGTQYALPGLGQLLLVVPVLEAGALLVGRRRAPTDAVRLALLALAVCMTIAAVYFPDLIHLAFIAPFTLVVAAGLVYRLRLGMPLRAAAAAIRLVLAAAVVAALHKGWTNLQLAHASVPVRYETAFGTVAGTLASRQTLEDVRSAVSAVPADRRTFFSYPIDASLYLTVPGENPTPFSLLMRGYNTPEQFRIACAALERTPPDYVIVTPRLLFEDDPVMTLLKDRYRYRTAAGPGDGYAIYERRERPAGDEGS
jgi:hypothetical protein